MNKATITRRTLLAGWMAAAAFASAADMEAAGDLLDKLDADDTVVEMLMELTDGRRVKIAYAAGNAFCDLFAFDTLAGNGARRRRLVSGTNGRIMRVNITHDGDRVIYGTMYPRATYAVDWEGGAHEKLFDGTTACLWHEPLTGREYAIVGTGPNGDHGGGPLWKVELDNPDNREIIWNSQGATLLWTTITDAGDKLGGGFPWNGCDVVLLPGRQKYTNRFGCFSEISPTGDYHAMFLGGGHQIWDISEFRFDEAVGDWEFQNLRRVDITGVRGTPLEGHPQRDAWFVYWSNETPYITLRIHERGVTLGPGPLYFAKFNDTMSGIEGWVRVVDDPSAGPSKAWIDPGVDQAKPRLALNEPGLSFVVDAGAGPVGKALTLRNAGGGALENIAVRDNADWLAVSVEGGGNGNRSLAHVVDVAGLEPGEYAAEATVSAGNARNSPLVYPVKLKLYGPPELARITIAPRETYLSPGASVEFVAQALDQKGNTFPADIEWKADAGSISPGPEGRAMFKAPPDERRRFVITASAGAARADAVASTLPMHLKINCGIKREPVPGWERDDPYAIEGTVHEVREAPFKDEAQKDKAAPQAVYRTVRTGGELLLGVPRHRDPNGQVFAQSYDFPHVPDGDYIVRIHFNNNTWFSGGTLPDGMRITVLLEDNEALCAHPLEVAPHGFVSIAECRGSVSDGNGLRVAVQQSRKPDYPMNVAGIEIIGCGQEAVVPALVLKTPRGGERWEVGGTQFIEWVASGITDARILLSRDNGATWDEIVPAVDSESRHWLRFPWKVGFQTIEEDDNGEPVWTPLDGKHESEQCLLFIQDYVRNHDPFVMKTPFEISHSKKTNR